jgi:hypothetical protein
MHVKQAEACGSTAATRGLRQNKQHGRPACAKSTQRWADTRQMPFASLAHRWQKKESRT